MSQPQKPRPAGADVDPADLPEQPRNVDELEIVAAKLGVRRKDLIVLSYSSDPFNTGSDGKTRDAEWFADLWRRFGFRSGVHCRRVHYRIISADTGIVLADGETYVNTEHCFRKLVGAANHARDLGLVDPTLFADRRNPAVVRHAAQRLGGTEPFARVGGLAELPSWTLPEADRWWSPSFGAEDLMSLDITGPAIDSSSVGRVEVTGYDYDPGDQPFYEVLWIEKSTMDDVLEPICRDLGIDFAAGKGFNSKTRAVELLVEARRHGKPLRVFTIADFDPGGVHMAPAIARHLEYYRDIIAPDVEVAVRHLGMHAEWVERYELPRAPIEDSEHGSVQGRADNFEDRHGEGYVELDALEALHPGRLADELRSAIRDYRDHSLRERLSEVRGTAKQSSSATWLAATDSVREELSEIEDEADTIADRFRGRIAEIEARRDETMAPFIAKLERLEAEAREALAPARQDYQTVLGELDAEFAPYRRRLAELRNELHELATDTEFDLPDRPDPEVDVDESGVLFDSRRHWWEQLQRYHEFQGRETGRQARPCVECGIEFEAVRKDAKYCSSACYQRAKAIGVQHPPRPCPLCGTEFTPKRSDAIYCSRACSKKAHARRQRNGGGG